MYYHNNNSHFAARKFAYCKDWIVPIFIPRSSYMESEVYRHHFMQLQHNWTEHYDFVLTCTFRHTVPTETRVTPLSTESLKHMIKTAVHMNYDVMPLEIYPIFDIKYSLLRFHGRNSFKAFSSLLEKKGYNRNQIEKSGDIRAFWRSSFLIRSSVMQNLTNWMVNAMHIVDNDTDVKWWFKHDAVYFSGDPIVAFQVFGTPYYQMHPFIFERLPAFYLSMERKSVYFYNRSVPIVPVVENSTMLS
ncbi:hypothetical protein EON65_23745 [archaeon]|nr:MAG: hypothetical protein EON65_23745 [archaeon]